MSCYVYADYSNVWIEGMHVSAVAKKMAQNILDAQQQDICDKAWRIDFGKLYVFSGGNDISSARLYGSRPPPNDSLWDAARKKGFEPVIFDRNFFNKEKKVDTQITADIMEDLYEKIKKGDEITLLAGDADFVPVCEKAKKRGVNFDVAFWDHAAKELKATASNFVSLNQFLDHLKLK
jgi:uncharacterized LabA/DUF88 family protein